MVVTVTCGEESDSLKTSLSFYFVSVTAMEEDFFIPGSQSVHVEFVVHKVLGQVFLRVLLLSPIIIPPLLRARISFISFRPCIIFTVGIVAK